MKKKWFPAAVLVFSLLTSLFWTALRVNYSGISKFLGADTNPTFLVMNLPVLICVLAWAGTALAAAGMYLWPKRKWPTVSALVLGGIIAVASVVVILFGAKDYLRFILVHFWESVAVAGALAVLALALWCPLPGGAKGNAVKTAVMAAAVLVAVILGYELRPCSFTYGAVVYAVEDTYQIVFSTSDSAAAWVEIDGECYYDLYAGSMRSADRVHKVTVPQAALDAAGGYSIHARQMIYRGPFGGYMGECLCREYDFRPVDTSDGLQYFALSDVHEAVDAAVGAVPQDRAEPMDLLVLLGDLVSMVETEADAQLANDLAHRITGGSYPVIYARGNHEIKGEYGEVLYKYVGSKNQSFAYTVTLSDQIFALVLDLGEDHADDWWEYYGTAKFDLYRQEQTQLLSDVLAEGQWQEYPYRMALCHIPITYVDDGELFAPFRREWTALLNDMQIDICISGHEHELWQMLPGAVEPWTQLRYQTGYTGDSGEGPGGYLTDFAFPAFLAGRRSLDQSGGTQKDGSTDYVGMYVHAEPETGRQTVQYVNSRQEIISGIYPFVGAYPAETFRDIVLQKAGTE